jgi:hypothetical protein
MKLSRGSFGLACAIAIVGCAHTPPVRVNYYLAQSEVSFKVIRTVSCDEGNHPIVATSVTPTVRHSADLGHGPETIELADLKGPLSDTDLKFEFYEDGRLKGVNATSTGQGEGIFKSAISLIATAALGTVETDLSTECANIKKWNGGKPLTVSFEGVVLLDKNPLDTEQSIPAEAGSVFYAKELREAIGDVCATVTRRTGVDAPGGPSAIVAAAPPIVSPAQYSPQKAEALIKLRQPGRASISVTSGPPGACSASVLWSGDVLAGQFGQPYVLPLPRAAVFGKQVFAISLSESGSLTSLQYASNTGAGQALNVASAALTAAQGPTDAQRAAQLKAEGDVIAAQQRLVQCQAHPETCK